LLLLLLLFALFLPEGLCGLCFDFFLVLGRGDDERIAQPKKETGKRKKKDMEKKMKKERRLKKKGNDRWT